MKRDMELVRKILMTIEDEPTGRMKAMPVFEGYSEDQVGHHCYLLKQAGLINAVEQTTNFSQCETAFPTEMTWAGHEFLASSRDPAVWKKAMSVMAEKGGALSFGVLSQLLTSLAKSHLGLP